LRCGDYPRRFAVVAAIITAISNAPATKGQSARTCDQDKPFSAEMVEHIDSELPDGTMQKQEYGGLRARDSNGKFYAELVFKKIEASRPDKIEALRPEKIEVSRPAQKGPTIHSTFSISDCQTGQRADVFPDQKLVRITPSSTLPAWQRKDGSSLYEWLIRGQVQNRIIEDLGFKEFEGIVAHGYRETVIGKGTEEEWSGKPTFVMESWVCDDIAEVVFQKIENPKVKSITTVALTKIKRGEPQKALFDIPSDYTVEHP
jgi:hypothetical protein